MPRYCLQIGRVVDSPADFYSSRIPQKERKRTLVDELMADAEFKRYAKRKYGEILSSDVKRRKKAYKHAKRLKKLKKK
jgi:DNA-directed RNA polymerase subunit N (RpoN/RPB10)